MKDYIKNNKIAQLILSAIVPAIILIIKPLGLNFNQAMVVSALIMVVIWWSTGIVKKIPASCFLLAVFAIFSTAPLKTVFSFPLSESFFLIALTYLFSQGIANSGLVDKLAQPILLKYANTPLKTLGCIIVVYIVTMYMIPQPLARLIMVAVLFDTYLKKTTTPHTTRTVIMFSCFVFYALVNMATKNADIIMNTATTGFAGLEMSDGQWMQYMLVPTVIYTVMIFGLFVYLFRKDLLGIKIQLSAAPAEKTGLSSWEKKVLSVVVITVVLWMTASVHHLNSTLITAVSIGLLFVMKALSLKDLKSIDVTTLVFLTAAFSIGGVMKACGAADIVFSKIKGIFPAEYSVWYLLIMVLVCMMMHMILGSNTTTLSIVIPGLMIICADVLPAPIIMFIAFISVAFHSILPFHSVAMMIGASNNYFPGRYVAKLGIPVTILVFVSAVFIFMPWWQLMGLV